MTRLRIASLLLVALTPGAVGVAGSPVAPGEVGYSGSLRTRFEARRDYKFDDQVRGNDEDLLFTQLRVGAEWKATKWLGLTVELQDARLFNETALNDRAVPTFLADQVDLHRAQVDLSFAGSTPWAIRLGRQKLTLGEQRVVSPLEWVNTARVFDGLRVTVGKVAERALDLFATRLVPVDPREFNDHHRTGNRMFDSFFHGLYYRDVTAVKGLVFEGYYLLRKNGRAGDEVHTAGSRIVGKGEAWWWSGEGALQFGQFGKLDHRAMALHLEGSRGFADLNQLRVGLAYNYASGDEDRGDDRHQTFDNLYPLNHVFYGYMDFFSWQNLHNLEATASLSVAGFTPRVAVHAFWLSEEDSDSWYEAGLGALRPPAGRDVKALAGHELDLTVSRALGGHARVEAGYGHFFTGPYVRDTGMNRDPDFFYLQATIKL